MKGNNLTRKIKINFFSLIMGFYYEIMDSANERAFDQASLETTVNSNFFFKWRF